MLIETFDLLTIPLMSTEFERSPLYREIKVRIWYDEHGGMQAEPIAWYLRRGRPDNLPARTVCTGGPPPGGARDDMWHEVVQIVMAEYDEDELERIRGEHVAFRDLQRQDRIDAEVERAEYRRSVL